MGIVRAFLQEACRSIAAVVVSDSYCVHRLRVAWNSICEDKFGRPVPKIVQSDLSRLYNFQPLDLNNLWSDQ